MKPSVSKKLGLIVAAAALLFPIAAWGEGGDLGGGGRPALERALRLTPDEAQSLRRARTEQEQFNIWRQILRRDARDQGVMENLFNDIVVPQLE